MGAHKIKKPWRIQKVQYWDRNWFKRRNNQDLKKYSFRTIKWRKEQTALKTEGRGHSIKKNRITSKLWLTIPWRSVIVTRE